MLDTSIISVTAAASKVLFNDTTKKYMLTAWEKLIELLSEQRQQYVVQASQNPTSPFELKRQSLITQLGQLQNDIVLNVAHQETQAKLLPIVLEQLLGVYQSKSEEDLAIVEMSLVQTVGYLKQYRRMMNDRAWARWAAVLVSLAALIGLGILVLYGYTPGGPSVDTVLPILEIPLPILIWSTIGSFASILYRFNQSGDMELQDPLRWLFTRPLTGIVMGAIAYFVAKIGLLSIATDTSIPIGTLELFWLIAFIAGFSDRFADTLLRSLAGRFGGDPRLDLVDLHNPSLYLELPSTNILTDVATKIRDRIQSLGVHRENKSEPTTLQQAMPGDESSPEHNPVSSKNDLGHEQSNNK